MYYFRLMIIFVLSLFFVSGCTILDKHQRTGSKPQTLICIFSNCEELQNSNADEDDGNNLDIDKTKETNDDPANS